MLHLSIYLLVFFSLRFNGHWISVIRYQNISVLNFIGAKDDEGGGNNWSYKTCKATFRMSPPPSFYRPDVLPVAQPAVLKH